MNLTNKELFAQAIHEGVSRRIELELSETNEKVVPSSEYYRRLSETLGFSVRRIADKRTIMKRYLIAAIAAALILLVGCTAIVYKEKIGDFFVEIRDTYIKVNVVSEENANNQVIEEYYTLTYAPEGYELVEESCSINIARFVWKNDKDKSIIFSQLPINSAKYTIDGEHGFTCMLTYNQYTVYCRTIDETFYYIWSNEYYVFSLYSDTEINEDEIIKLIESITVKQK